MKKIMIVDTSAVCYALMYTIGKADLSCDGQPTGIIYGFFNSMNYLFKTIKPTVTVFACDSKHSKRKELYPSYKDKREKEKKEKTPEEKLIKKNTYNQVTALRRKILPYIGFKNVFQQSGHEADDIIATLCHGYSQTQIVIVTRDKDMYQLLSNNISMFDPQTKQFTTRADFIEKYGIEPKLWGKAKQYAGCTTDCVEGIEGVGDIKACKYILGTQPKGVVRDRIESPEGKAIFERNEPLVVLPFKGTKKFKIVLNKFNRERFKKVCEKFDFRSITMTINDWSFL